MVVTLNDDDIADILEIPSENELECLEEGSFPHPEYCDKYFTCTDQSGVLKVGGQTFHIWDKPVQYFTDEGDDLQTGGTLQPSVAGV